MPTFLCALTEQPSITMPQDLKIKKPSPYSPY